MRVAALDFGTNTFLLLIADVEGGHVRYVHHDEARVVRLGQGVHESRRFHPDALQRADQCLRDFASVIQRANVDKVLACATSAARDVSNGTELSQIADKYGIPIEVISGEREAELTFLGTVDQGLSRPSVIVDVGGGSTEYILGDGTGIKARASLDIGSVRLTESFITRHPIPTAELQRMSDAITDKLSGLEKMLKTIGNVELLAVAGTPTTLAAMDLGIGFDASRIDGAALSLEKLQGWVSQLASMTIEERRQISGMEPQRADVIVAGTMILMRSCEYFQAQKMTVSTKGLRYGIARSLESRGE